MNILVICQHYYPEPFRITDICEGLVRRGHGVTVLTGIPNYPMGEIYSGYRHGKRRDEVINGVRIHRCFTIGRRHGALFRVLNYYSYALSSSRYASRLGDDFDVVFINQLSPVMMARAGIKYKKKHHKKLVLYCLDLWPESLVCGGISRKSPIFKAYRRVSGKIYRQADRILVTSRAFSEYFRDVFGIENTEYLPQYAEAVFSPEQCAKTPDGVIDLMFAGNVGAAQSVETIIEASRLTRDEARLRWHIVGDGSELENVKRLAREYALTSVIFHGRQPLEEMPRYYAMADAMLVTMRKDPFISLTLPGKVQTYMAAGKPVIGAIDAEARSVIDDAGCGFCCEAENAHQLAACALAFMKNQSVQLSENSLRYYRAHFSEEAYMNKLISELRQTCRTI